MKPFASSLLLFLPLLVLAAPVPENSSVTSPQVAPAPTAPAQTGGAEAVAPGSSPTQFWFYYSFQPSPGKRTWKKVDAQTWSESFGNEVINHYVVIGPKTLGQVRGTLLVKIGADAPGDTTGRGEFQVFIPNLDAHSNQIWYHSKVNNQWDTWKKLGLMEGASASSDENAPAVSNHFASAATGLSLSKPEGWHVASVKQIESRQDGIRFLDKDPDDPQRGQVGVFLVVLVKHPLPFAGLNPSVHVRIRPRGLLQQNSAEEILEHFMPALQQSMADFSYIDRVEATRVGGLPAARMRAVFRATSAQGGEFPTLATLWAIPRGEFIFLVSTAGPPNGPDVSEAEFKAIIDSIKIEK